MSTTHFSAMSDADTSDSSAKVSADPGTMPGGGFRKGRRRSKRTVARARGSPRRTMADKDIAHIKLPCLYMVTCLRNYVRAFLQPLHARAKDTKDAIEFDVEHLTLLLALLIYASQLITELVADDPFWTRARNAGLTLDVMFSTAPTLLKAASRAGVPDAVFWMSKELESTYWMHNLHHAFANAREPAAVLIMKYRLNTVAPVLRRLHHMLTHITTCSPTAAANAHVQALIIHSASFLRVDPLHDPDADTDPHLHLARDFHSRQFAGDLHTLPTSFRDEIKAFLRKFPEDVAGVLHVAIIKAGQQFNSVVHSTPDDVSTLELYVADCGRLLLSFVEYVDILSNIFQCLRSRVEQEQEFFRVFTKDVRLTHRFDAAGGTVAAAV
jgi:hypothetical protein